jgi:hypothetical protein
MKMMHLLAALMLVPVLGMPATARTKTRVARVFVGTRAPVGTQPQPYRSEGREIIAPPWSAACMTDHGPSQCGEHMWIYGSGDAAAW